MNYDDWKLDSNDTEQHYCITCGDEVTNGNMYCSNSCRETDAM